MMTLTMILGMFVGYEGYDDGKLYIGTYTPTCEYGWVISNGEIYLDTISVSYTHLRAHET